MQYSKTGQKLFEHNATSLKSYLSKDPKQKQIFINQLYAALHSDYHNTLKQLPLNNTGLKLHFQIEFCKNRQYKNLPSPVFLRKASFFSNQLIVSFPFQYTNSKTIPEDDRKNYVLFGKYNTEVSGNDYKVKPLKGKYSHYYIKKNEFEVFLDTLCQSRELLASEVLHIFPTIETTSCRPNILNHRKFGLHSANFTNQYLLNQFLEEKSMIQDHSYIILPTLYRPYFSEIQTKEMLDVRKQEKILFSKFQSDLSELFSDNYSATNEKNLLKKMKEIDHCVQYLNQQHDALIKCLTQKNCLALLGLICAGVAIAVPIPLVSNLLHLVGTASIISGVHEYANINLAKKNLREKPHYIFWKLRPNGLNYTFFKFSPISSFQTFYCNK